VWAIVIEALLKKFDPTTAANMLKKKNSNPRIRTTVKNLFAVLLEQAHIFHFVFWRAKKCLKKFFASKDGCCLSETSYRSL